MITKIFKLLGVSGKRRLLAWQIYAMLFVILGLSYYIILFAVDRVNELLAAFKLGTRQYVLGMRDIDAIFFLVAAWIMLSAVMWNIFRTSVRDRAMTKKEHAEAISETHLNTSNIFSSVFMATMFAYFGQQTWFIVAWSLLCGLLLACYLVVKASDKDESR